MEKTKTRRAPERPKATKVAEPVMVQETVVMEPKAAPKPKKRTIKRQDKQVHNCEFEIIKGGGIVFMLPQKGVTIYDKEKDTIREIRYCPNEPSIYVDEQSSNALKQSVAFRDGRIFVPKNKPNLRDFLEVHPANSVNGGTTFRKVDKKQDAKDELEKEFLLTDAISVVRDRDINDLLPIAIYFGININASVSDIRYSLLRIAKTKTKEFLESLDSPQVSCRATIQQAADYQILNMKSNGVYWFDSNQLIISVPVGQDAVDTMVRFCLTEKGASALSLIEERLDKLA
mgnify:FL=1|jgi:hypothetical protein|tara:strand:- start:293 stop:1153 length:861 start_codon:yes stop_codon:yes gene_type:complete